MENKKSDGMELMSLKNPYLYVGMEDWGIVVACPRTVLAI